MTDPQRIPTLSGRGQRDREAGAAMMVAVMVITAVAVLCTSVAVLATRSTRAAGETRTAGVVKDLANAGLAEGVTYLRQVGVTSAIDSQPVIPDGSGACAAPATTTTPAAWTKGAPPSSMLALRARTGCGSRRWRLRVLGTLGRTGSVRRESLSPARASGLRASERNTPPPLESLDPTPCMARETSTCSPRLKSSATCPSTASTASTVRATSRRSAAPISRQVSPLPRTPWTGCSTAPARTAARPATPSTAAATSSTPSSRTTPTNLVARSPVNRATMAVASLR